jgi:hypothetical protein
MLQQLSGRVRVFILTTRSVRRTFRPKRWAHYGPSAYGSSPFDALSPSAPTFGSHRREELLPFPHTHLVNALAEIPALLE